MKYFIFCAILLGKTLFANSQNFLVTNERLNVFYVGVDNPVSIVATNVKSKDIVAKATFGKLLSEYGRYTFHIDSLGIGSTEIVVYKRGRSKLTEIGRSVFRLRRIPPPVFKIGSGRPIVRKAELVSQKFVRAEMENIDIDYSFNIEKFSVEIMRDSGKTIIIENTGGHISKEVSDLFGELKTGDRLYFRNIFITMFAEKQIELDPIMITIIE